MKEIQRNYKGNTKEVQRQYKGNMKAIQRKHKGNQNGANVTQVNKGFINKRALARGVSESEYMQGNLLKREVLAEDVAKAFLDLANSKATTGAVLTVDGGNISAALR